MVGISINLTSDSERSLAQQLEAELTLVSLAKQLVGSKVTSDTKAREAILESFAVSETWVRERYDFSDGLDFFAGERISDDTELVALKFLPKTFEKIILENPPLGLITSLYNDLCQGFQLPLGDLSFYVRELDPLSTRKKVGLSAKEIARYEVARKLTHAYVECHLLRGDLDSFQRDLLVYRRSLTPAMLLQSIIRLHWGFKKPAPPELLGIIFGGRLESALKGEKSTKIGHISLDQHLRQFFLANNLAFTTDGLLLSSRRNLGHPFAER